MRFGVELILADRVAQAIRLFIAPSEHDVFVKPNVIRKTRARRLCHFS